MIISTQYSMIVRILLSNQQLMFGSRLLTRLYLFFFFLNNPPPPDTSPLPPPAPLPTSRTSIMYADRPCRINTYGDSFTQCHQVSDHETWQEYLAAHLGEPIRNFGMGGYGFYQAYRRRSEEHTSELQSPCNLVCRLLLEK